MKVTYILDSFPKTSETFVRDEVSWMQQKGMLGKLYCLGSELVAARYVSEDVLNKSSHVGVADVIRSVASFNLYKLFATELFRNLRYVRKVRHITRLVLNCAYALSIARAMIREGCPDVIHAHFASNASQIAMMVSGITKVPFTFMCHRYDIFDQPAYNYNLLARRSANVFTISDYNSRYLQRKFDIATDRIAIVHCGIDVNTFKFHEPRLLSERKRINILSVGRLVSQKAQWLQVEAAKLLREAGVDFKWSVIGDGPERASLEQRIEANLLQSCFALCGAQPSHVVRDSLDKADIFVMSSESEGIPVSLMEAMATGVPVVTTAVNGIPELVRHEDTGLLYPAGNLQAFVDSLKRLISDDGLRMMVVRNARSLVQQSFSREVEYPKLLTVWSRKCTDVQ